ncbi:MAG TPA: hypothetical protein V6C76_14570 [Drouetiella sp.]
MQKRSNRVVNSLAAMLCLLVSQSANATSESELQRIIRDGKIEQPTQLDQVNDFIGHSKVIGKPSKKLVHVAQGQINAKLITPLNSSFNHSGDDVKAVVVSSKSESGKPWLAEGTILEGTVETARKATYGQSDGSLTIRFYRARHGDDVIDLFAASETDDGTIKPGAPKPPTKKQKIRGILMTVTKIAVPAAIGTGGMSLAITTGAGAAIGLAFSEKGHRVSGTVSGAWEGAGLNFLDPIVCKGATVVVPADTQIQLQLSEAVEAPEVKAEEKKSTFRTEDEESTSIATIQTHAQILTPDTIAQNEAKSQQALARVNKKIEQNDLAAALVELQKAEDDNPNDSKLRDLHDQLLGMISGKTKTSAQN